MYTPIVDWGVGAGGVVAQVNRSWTTIQVATVTQNGVWGIEMQVLIENQTWKIITNPHGS